MKKIVQLTLGIMTALGGFVDLGQIVFTMQAGARFGYALLWSIMIGGVAIMLYMEMCGRVAAVAQQPVFAVVRTKLGRRLGIATLVGSNLLNLITCAAELGAVAIVLHLLFGVPERLAIVGGALLLGALIWLLNFQWIERTFGLAGLTMIVFAVAAWKFPPDWGAAASGLVPRFPGHGTKDLLLYAYFAVGIFSAMLMEYEVHFYSSGAIEEGWTAKDLPENSIVSTSGIVLGSLLTCALLILGALVFLPRSIFPDMLSTTALPVAVPLGPIALRLALVGILACVASAAVERLQRVPVLRHQVGQEPATEGSAGVHRYVGRNGPRRAAARHDRYQASHPRELLDRFRHAHHAADLLSDSQGCGRPRADGGARHGKGTAAAGMGVLRHHRDCGTRRVSPDDSDA